MCTSSEEDQQGTVVELVCAALRQRRRCTVENGSRLSLRGWALLRTQCLRFPECPTEIFDVHTLGRVLVVEDEDDIRALYAAWLEQAGFEVIQARDGTEGVSRAMKQQPKAILMDVAMPRMNGLEATRRLRSEQSTAKIPILILSAYTSPTDRERAFSAGADEFLGKPCDLELLASRLRHYVSEPG